MKKSNTKLIIFVSEYFRELTWCLNKLDITKIETVVNILTDAYRYGRQIFVLGNGGSSSTASHMANDLLKAKFRVISLTDNMAVITATANDISYEQVFVEQLQNLLRPKDVVIVFSASGNSANIIAAVAFAKKHGAKTIGFLGFKTGGKAARVVDHAIIVQSNRYGPVEDVHLALNHLLASYLPTTIHYVER